MPSEIIKLGETGNNLKDREELKISQVEDVNIYVTKYLGEYPDHKHPKDEFFYVLDGEIDLIFEGENSVTLVKGDGFRVPKETVHRPLAKKRTTVLKIEPAEFPFQIVEKKK